MLICQCRADCAAFYWFKEKCHYLWRYPFLFVCLSVFVSLWYLHVVYNRYWHFFFCFPFLCLGFPNEPAADIALKTVKRWIEDNPDKVGHACMIHVVDLRSLPHLWSNRLFLTFADLLWPEMIGPQQKHWTPIVMRLCFRQTSYPPALLGLHAYQIKSQSVSNRVLNGLLTV